MYILWDIASEACEDCPLTFLHVPNRMNEHLIFKFVVYEVYNLEYSLTKEFKCSKIFSLAMLHSQGSAILVWNGMADHSLMKKKKIGCLVISWILSSHSTREKGTLASWVSHEKNHNKKLRSTSSNNNFSMSIITTRIAPISTIIINNRPSTWVHLKRLRFDNCLVLSICPLNNPL